MRKAVSSLLIALVASLLTILPAGNLGPPIPSVFAASGATTPYPPNYNFESGPLQVGSGPTNYDFGSGGSGWTKIVGSVSYSGGVATLSSSTWLRSSSYTLASNVQAVKIRYKAGASATVMVKVGGTLYGQGNLSCVGCTSGDWVDKYIPVYTSAQGHSATVEILTSNTTVIDELGTQWIPFQQWNGGSTGTASQPKSNGAQFAEVYGNLYTGSFDLAENRLEFDYAFPLSSNNYLTLYLYRASDGATLASTSKTGGATGWTHVVWTVNSGYTGQKVYVRAYTSNSPAWLDNVASNLADGGSRSNNPSRDDGDPFDTSTGQMSHSHTDLYIPGQGVPLEFSRSYQSNSVTPGDLGYNWRHTYSTHLRIDSDSSVTVYYDTGGAAYFKYNSGSYDPPASVHDSLVHNGDGTYTLTTPNALENNFSSAGKLTSIVDRNGNTTTVSYDGSGYLSQVEDAGGRILTFTPDGSGRIVEIEDPIGRTVDFDYDSNGDLVEVTDAKGGTTTYTYSNHHLTSLTDSNTDLQTQTVYDGANRVVEQTDATGGTTCAYYGSGPSYSSAHCTGVSPSPSAGQTVVVNPRGYKTTYDYDTLFRTTSVTDNNSGVTSFSYDSSNNRTCVTDPDGNKTGFTYDSHANVTHVIDADNTDGSCNLKSGGVEWTFTYTSLNDPDTATDPLGRETDYIYDTDGNLTRVVRMDDSSNILLLTCFEYDNGDGLATAMVESTDLTLPGDADDPCTGHKTAFEYNSYGNPTAVTDPRFTSMMTPPQSILDPDDAGRVLSITDELSHATSVTYDNFDMPLTVTDELGDTTSWTYDAKGNVLTVTDANRQEVGATSEADVDGCGDAGTGDGVDDDSGDSDGVPDDGCPNTIYTYDAGDRLTSVVDALGHSTTYSYDASGNLVSVTDANRQAVGAPESGAACDNSTGDGDDDDSDTVVDDGCPSKIYAYDELNRLHTVTDVLGRVTTYNYDDASNLTERVDARGLITDYTPDALNRLDTIEYWNAAHTTMVGSVDYGYDAVGNRTQMVDSTGTTTFTPDALNRLESVTFPGSVSVSYGYDEVGDRTSITYPSTDEVDYTYDEGHRMETVTDGLSQQTTYHYDDAGRLDSAELPNGVDTDYTYDDANRLTDVTNTGPGPTTISDFHYELDADGNRTEMTDLSGTQEYVYDSLYRLTEVTYPDPETDAYTYDDNGNRLSLDSTSFTYDAANQMLTVGGVNYGYDDNGNQTSRGSDTFDYDHENRLIAAVTGSVTSTSLYNGDGLRMSLTVDDGSPVTTDYVWDVKSGLPVILDDGTNQYVYGLDLISATDGVGNQTYFTSDGHGSTADLTDDVGAATDSYSYDIFGAVRTHTGGSTNGFLFTGEQTDADTGLQYLRARYYDPVTGRFLSRDPLGGTEQYAYVHNNPANRIDPSGLCDVGLFDVPIPCPLPPKPPTPRKILNHAIDLLPEGTFFGYSYQLEATCALYAEKCPLAIALSIYADRETTRLYGHPREGTFGDPKEGDAFQHCFWGGIETLFLGASFSEDWTHRYEASGADNPTDQRAYDLYNDDRGRRYAQHLLLFDPTAISSIRNYCRGR